MKSILLLLLALACPLSSQDDVVIWRKAAVAGGGAGTLIFSDNIENHSVGTAGAVQTGSYLDVLCFGIETSTVKNGSKAATAGGPYVGGGCTFGKGVPGINFPDGYNNVWLSQWMYMQDFDGTGEAHWTRIFSSPDGGTTIDWDLVVSIENEQVSMCDYNPGCTKQFGSLPVSGNNNVWRCWELNVNIDTMTATQYIDGASVVSASLVGAHEAANGAHSVDNGNTSGSVIGEQIVDDVRIYSGGSRPGCA